MNYVNKEREIKRINFIRENKQEWAHRGQTFKQLREEKELPLTFVAMELGISPGRVKRFEEGEPVLESALIEMAYRHFLNYWCLSGEMARTLNKYR